MISAIVYNRIITVNYFSHTTISLHFVISCSIATNYFHVKLRPLHVNFYTKFSVAGNTFQRNLAVFWYDIEKIRGIQIH